MKYRPPPLRFLSKGRGEERWGLKVKCLSPSLIAPVGSVDWWKDGSLSRHQEPPLLNLSFCLAATTALISDRDILSLPHSFFSLFRHVLLPFSFKPCILCFRREKNKLLQLIMGPMTSTAGLVEMKLIKQQIWRERESLEGVHFRWLIY